VALKLNGSRRRQLHAALLSAFPDVESLTRMVSFQLGENLNTFTPSGTTLADVVFHLIQWAESRSAVVELVVAARTANPDNTDLGAIARQLGVTALVPSDAAFPPAHRAALEKLFALVRGDWWKLRASPDVITAAAQELRRVIDDLEDLRFTYPPAPTATALDATLDELDEALVALYQARVAARSPRSAHHFLFYD
jgi:hypothetical protein